MLTVEDTRRLKKINNKIFDSGDVIGKGIRKGVIFSISKVTLTVIIAAFSLLLLLSGIFSGYNSSSKV
jgi:hypothetical protein